MGKYELLPVFYLGLPHMCTLYVCMLKHSSVACSQFSTHKTICDFVVLTSTREVVVTKWIDIVTIHSEQGPYYYQTIVSVMIEINVHYAIFTNELHYNNDGYK